MSPKLQKDALSIVNKIIKDTDSNYLISEQVFCKTDSLQFHYQQLPLAPFERIFVIGAGKYSVPMATAINSILEKKYSIHV